MNTATCHTEHRKSNLLSYVRPLLDPESLQTVLFSQDSAGSSEASVIRIAVQAPLFSSSLHMLPPNRKMQVPQTWEMPEPDQVRTGNCHCFFAKCVSVRACKGKLGQRKREEHMKAKASLIKGPLKGPLCIQGGTLMFCSSIYRSCFYMRLFCGVN